MARTARSLHARKKRRKVLEQAKGYRGTKHTSYKRAKEQVWKSGVYAYEGRKQRKRDFRSLWIQRINAGAREHDISYSQLIHGLKLAEIDLDRKILADLAVAEPEVFAAVVTQAKNALEGNPIERRVKVERSAAPDQPRPAARRKPAPEPSEEASAEAPVETSTETEEVEATDATERRAEELDVDLSEVEGSGAEGRVSWRTWRRPPTKRARYTPRTPPSARPGSWVWTSRRWRARARAAASPWATSRRPRGKTGSHPMPGPPAISAKRAAKLNTKKHRETERLFLAEGSALIEEATAPPLQVFDEEEQVRRVSTLKTPTGPVGVFPFLDVPEGRLLTPPSASCCCTVSRTPATSAR
jgi:large subunit ribosomal protein L20